MKYVEGFDVPCRWRPRGAESHIDYVVRTHNWIKVERLNWSFNPSGIETESLVKTILVCVNCGLVLDPFETVEKETGDHKGTGEKSRLPASDESESRDLCCVCKINTVDVDAGYDTCPACLKNI